MNINSLDPGQDCQNVRPDLDPNCLQRLQQTTPGCKESIFVLILYIPVHNFSVMSG